MFPRIPTPRQVPALTERLDRHLLLAFALRRKNTKAMESQEVRRSGKHAA